MKAGRLGTSSGRRRKIGLALGSGSARGWAHIGILEALDEEGIRPDVVSGCSIGALVGASYVAGRLPQLKQWAEALTWREIIGLIDVSVSSGGLISGARNRSALTRLGIGGPIESYAIRFAAIATDLVTGREVWLESGEIDEAVRASIALPGLFSPHPSDGAWLVDGGFVNPVPVSTCRAFGAEITIAVNLNGDLVGRRGAGWGEPHDVPGSDRREGRGLEPLRPRDTGRLAPSRLYDWWRNFCDRALPLRAILKYRRTPSTLCRTGSPAAVSPASRRMCCCCRDWPTSI